MACKRKGEKKGERTEPGKSHGFRGFQSHFVLTGSCKVRGKRGVGREIELPFGRRKINRDCSKGVTGTSRTRYGKKAEA